MELCMWHTKQNSQVGELFGKCGLKCWKALLKERQFPRERGAEQMGAVHGELCASWPLTAIKAPWLWVELHFSHQCSMVMTGLPLGSSKHCGCISTWASDLVTELHFSHQCSMVMTGLPLGSSKCCGCISTWASDLMTEYSQTGGWCKQAFADMHQQKSWWAKPDVCQSCRNGVGEWTTIRGRNARVQSSLIVSLFRSETSDGSHGVSHYDATFVAIFIILILFLNNSKTCFLSYPRECRCRFCGKSEAVNCRKYWNMIPVMELVFFCPFHQTHLVITISCCFHSE